MEPASPIFILGLTRRTGTNFAYQLLALHPDVAPAKHLTEDFALHDAQLLREYARRVRRQWNPRWGFRDDAEARLLRSLGQALHAFLVEEGLGEAAGSGRRPLFKTPSVRNLDLFFDLFPSASLLILVRDGRDVVESGVRSFGWSYEGSTRSWCRAARAVLEFDRAHRGRARYRIVRYEDLVADPGGTLGELLAFLRLDAGRYDLEAARALPVYGSSTFRGDRRELHWQPVPRSEAFSPVGRWESWSTYRRRRFAWMAGDLMAALGYDLGGSPSRWERAKHRLVDRILSLEDVQKRVSASGRMLRRGIDDATGRSR
jgi:hypothetical protein